MSHLNYTKVTIKAEHLDCLEKAAKRLNATAKLLATKTFVSYQGNLTCEYAISIETDAEQQYQVGVVINPTGQLVLAYDGFSSGQRLEISFGKGMSELISEYGHEVATKQLVEQGFEVHRISSSSELDEFNAQFIEFGEEPLVWTGETITAGVTT